MYIRTHVYSLQQCVYLIRKLIFLMFLVLILRIIENTVCTENSSVLGPVYSKGIGVMLFFVNSHCLQVDISLECYLWNMAQFLPILFIRNAAFSM